MNDLVPNQSIEDINKYGLFSIVFPYSPSVNYPMAITFAKQADHYRQLDDESDKKKALHLASFGKTKDQAGHASALLRLVGKWTGTQVYTQSKILADPFHTSQILECYFQSLTLSDYRAHCTWSASRFDGAEPGTIFPCKQIRGWTDNEYQEQENTEFHKMGIKIIDRIRDLGVRKNCDWCPHFKMENFKQI